MTGPSGIGVLFLVYAFAVTRVNAALRRCRAPGPGATKRPVLRSWERNRSRGSTPSGVKETRTLLGAPVAEQRASPRG